MAALITYNAWLGTRLNVYDTTLALDHIVLQPARLKRKMNDSLSDIDSKSHSQLTKLCPQWKLCLLCPLYRLYMC